MMHEGVIAQCGPVVKPEVPKTKSLYTMYVIQWTNPCTGWNGNLCHNEEERDSWIKSCEEDGSPYRVCTIPGAETDE